MFLEIPGLQDILIILVLIVTIVILILLLTRKTSNDYDQLNKTEDSIIDKVRGLETSLSERIFESMLKFSDNVNDQLRKQTDMSNDNIAEFRIKVNKELVEFQSKINESLSKDFKSLNESVEKRMNDINQKVDTRLDKGFTDTNQTFVQIAERVKVIDEAQKKIESLSNEMIGLQNILSNNQARGSFGEYQLNQLLFSLYGDNKKLYETQYTIKENRNETVRADAVIFMPEPHGIIAIDSKFPYSSYKKLFDNKDIDQAEREKITSDFGREVKKHITDIARKYIVPGITADYAIMFVPSDGILALLHSELVSVVEYARDKLVTIVSPTTLVPLLSSFQAVMIDHERSKHTKEIIDQLKKLKQNFKLFGEEWEKLNRSIERLRVDGDKVNNRVDKLTNKFEDIDKVSFIEEKSANKPPHIAETNENEEI